MIVTYAYAYTIDYSLLRSSVRRKTLNRDEKQKQLLLKFFFHLLFCGPNWETCFSCLVFFLLCKPHLFGFQISNRNQTIYLAHNMIIALNQIIIYDAFDVDLMLVSSKRAYKNIFWRCMLETRYEKPTDQCNLSSIICPFITLSLERFCVQQQVLFYFSSALFSLDLVFLT